ncbi:SWIM zinc finger family protein [Lusitaniella coriacea LEGE 07157]|uniref:SWIM zinc finger family protein n=1 Tax=Lusitaniella coriacea LEGE 07157 TaxID=945747 RepID=A0A8J7DVV8_9CYAN|nr:SWIM zinc finger family protein [Lusitaniella coriacea]MBE9116056.1 SWIM zinc finger family protein [Lusitaniella coriacea LEGE 07157]
MNSYEIDSREWWVERWLELLDSYRFKKRLERARRYANEGNVEKIEFKGSKVLAKVKGSEAEPYNVSLSLTPFSDEDWNYAIETMSEKALFSAQLLAGEMPANIEEVFTANGLSLFPFTLADIHSRCSCPDKANPCKHIGAIYYQLGDRFSEDPFVLFQLRGRTRSQILDALRQLRSKGAGGKGGKNKKEKLGNSKSKHQTPQTPLDLAHFWLYDEPLEAALVVIAPSPESKTALDLLGTIPLPSAEASVVRQYLAQAYQMASQQAVVTALNRGDS